jgi:hypothetical protein
MKLKYAVVSLGNDRCILASSQGIGKTFPRLSLLKVISLIITSIIQLTCKTALWTMLWGKSQDVGFNIRVSPLVFTRCVPACVKVGFVTSVY